MCVVVAGDQVLNSPPSSLSPSLLPFLPPSLPSSLPPFLPPSLSPFLPSSLPPSLPLFLPSDFQYRKCSNARAPLAQLVRAFDRPSEHPSLNPGLSPFPFCLLQFCLEVKPYWIGHMVSWRSWGKLILTLWPPCIKSFGSWGSQTGGSIYFLSAMNMIKLSSTNELSVSSSFQSIKFPRQAEGGGVNLGQWLSLITVATSSTLWVQFLATTYYKCTYQTIACSNHRLNCTWAQCARRAKIWEGSILGQEHA